MKGISRNLGHRCIGIHRCGEILGSKVKVTAGDDPENCVNAISSELLELISPKSGHICTWA